MDIAYNLEYGMRLILTFAHMVHFGGISIYEWVGYIVSMFLGMAIFAYMMRNLYGLARVGSASMFEGIWQGLNDPDAGVQPDYDPALDEDYSRRMSPRDRLYYDD